MTTATQKIPSGYKRTEIGVIPADWDAKTIEELCIPSGLVRGPFGGALKKEFFVPTGYKVYEQRNAIYGNVEVGKYYINREKFDELKRFEVEKNDFIVSCSGTIGKIYKIPERFEKGIINQALLKITLDTSLFSADYFEHYFSWENFQKIIIDGTQGGAMKNLVGMSEFKKTLLALPKAKSEQSAIASALSDVDLLTKKLEQLLEKKRNIKQGAMQELFTGKRRLSGFSEKWEITTLGKIADFEHGYGLSKSDLKDGGRYKCIHYGQLFTKYKELIAEIISKTNLNFNAFYSKENDVLMPTSDVTPRGLATASCIKEDGVILGGGILVIRLNPEYDGLYLSYFINQNKNSVLKLVKGSTVFHLYANDLANLEITFPKLVEQKAIVQIIADMDTEIEKLESQLTKYQNIKQGMMQTLLTGKIRLLTK